MNDGIRIERLGAALDRPFLACTEEEYLEDERAAYEYFHGVMKNDEIPDPPGGRD